MQHHDTHPFEPGEKQELYFSIACGVLSFLGLILEKNHQIFLVVYLLAYFFGSWYTLKEMIHSLKHKEFKIDFLMLLAAAGAAVLGEWFEGGLLLFLFTLGHSLEHFAMKKARGAISGLSDLMPVTALLLDEEQQEKEVPVEELNIGDRILVKPNTRFPVDGFISLGESCVNQAPITGESIPVDKKAVDDIQSALQNIERIPSENKVFAGTINGVVALQVIVTKKSSDSTLARVVQMVENAESQKSQTQQFTDRFEHRFVPVILSIVFLLLFAWVVVDETIAQSFYRAMAVLVAASPCALALSTPSAVLSGIARAAKAGVLIKGGAHLEALGMIKSIAFDKTGTLTIGQPKLVEVIAFSGTSEQELLELSANIEKQSDHPLAQAIVDGANQRIGHINHLEIEKIETLIGYGIKANLADQVVFIAKPKLFQGQYQPNDHVDQAIEKLKTLGQTVILIQRVMHDGSSSFLGALGVMDLPRKNAKSVIATLHEIGIEKTMMLTGDHQAVAQAVGQEVGISAIYGDLLPEQKVEMMKTLAQSDLVAMVGDGVNDAPAMANATVGIAIGASGSDVALEAADIALMSDDLAALPFAVKLSRKTRMIIKQNLWISLGMVAFLIPVTVFGFASMGVAVALHEGSTLVVVLNALRLLRFKD